MSVINNMLRNLDARRMDAGNDEVLPEEVLAAPRGRKPARRSALIVPFLLAVLVLGALYFWPRPVSRLPQPAVIADTNVVAESAVQPALADPELLVSSSVTEEAKTKPAVAQSEPTLGPRLALAMTPSVPINRVERLVRADVPREASHSSHALSPHLAKPRSSDLPPAEPLPVVAQPVTVVSPTVNGVTNGAASIRVEQSTQTSQERNLTEVQHAADLQRRGALVEAETSLRGVLDNDKSMLAARLALVSLLSRQQRGDEARRVLKDGVDIAPTQTQLLLPYARLLAARGEWRPAHEVLVPAAEALAQDAEYRALCGTVLQRLGLFSQASVEYRAALRLIPSAGAWWVGLGLSLEGDSRPVEARNAYLQARGNTLGPDLAQFVENKLARLGPAE